MTQTGPGEDRSSAAAAAAAGAWALGGYAVLVGLLLRPLVFAGYYVRPASDDWCLVPLGRDGGVSAVVTDIYENQNGRLGNAFVNGLVFAHYPVASKVFPGLVLGLLVLILSAMWTLLLRRLIGRPWETVAAGAALGTTMVVVMLLAKPHQYQTLFHAPTIISHTLTVFIAAAIVILGHLGTRFRWLTVAAVFLASAVLGTFNEAFTAACLVAVAMTVLARILVPRAVGVRLPLVAGAGLLAGFISVYVSPGSRNRQQLIRNGSVLDPEVWRVSLDNWWVVARFVLSRNESVLLVVAAVVVGLLLVRFPPSALRGRSGVALVVLPLVGGLVASYAATFVLSYAFNGQLRMRERTWPSITLPLLLAAAWLVIVAASATASVTRTALGRRHGTQGRDASKARRAALGVGILTGMVVLSLVGLQGTGRDVSGLVTTTVTRAHAWDKLDSRVRRLAATGAQTVPITPVPIDGLYEPFYPNRRNIFPATCVPGYYKVEHIRPVLVKKKA